MSRKESKASKDYRLREEHLKTMHDSQIYYGDNVERKEMKVTTDPVERNRVRMRNTMRANKAKIDEDVEGYMRYRRDAGLSFRGQKNTLKTGSYLYANRAKRIAHQTRSIADEAKDYSEMASATASQMSRSNISSSSSDYPFEPDMLQTWVKSSTSFPDLDEETSERIVDKLKLAKNSFTNKTDDNKTDASDFSDSEDDVVDLPQMIFDNNGIAGSMDLRPVSSNDDSFQKTYNDSLVPESHLQQIALDSEEYKGVDPHNLSQQDRDYIQQQREIEYKEDIQKIYDRVEEAEILSGGNKDSLFSATDLNLDGQGDSLYPEEKHFMSAYERGQNAHSVKEVDLDNFDFSEFADNLGDDDEKHDLFRGGDNIMSSIKALTELSADDGGSWFSEDKSMSEYITPEQRISTINKAPFNNDIRERLGKYNGRIAGSDNKMLRATGASLGTINEMRKGEQEKSNYRQPSRSYKGNAVNLVRNSRRKGILLEQQYDP